MTHSGEKNIIKLNSLIQEYLGKEPIMKRMDKIEPMTDEMIAALGRLVRHESVQGDPLPGKPFGEGPAACLAEALQIAQDMGFSVANMENYCGYAEMGEGKDIIGLCAHLDVVPAGEGWDTDPYVMTRKGNLLYGRGVSDDKGAVIASLYAMKLVKESGVPLKKRVRLLMGCNEETGSACMAYYAKHGEPITAGFTPDGNFPGIHGEKGSCHMTARSKHTKILSMNGGFVSNAVCNRCVTKVPAAKVPEDALCSELKKTALTAWKVTEENGVLTIEAQGVAAHASTPLQGVNAAGCTMQALKNAGMQDDFVDFYLSHIGTACDGAGIGCKTEDAYGNLTLNNGIVRTENGQIICTIDIRYPVTLKPEQLRTMAEPYLEDSKGSITIDAVGEPLFYPEDSALVQNLLKAYQEVTGDSETRPMVIGGGTYAKSVPGIIAFGCEFPGDDNHIHDANESLKIRDFQMQVDIYAQAILNLLQD